MTPTHKTKYSAGADLHCAETVTIQPNCPTLVKTGAYTPERLRTSDMVYLLCIRSSIALNKSLILATGVGVIDCDYPDEIKVMMVHFESEPVTIEAGERIAQLVPMTYRQGVFPTESTERKGGFGSTDEAVDGVFIKSEDL